MSESLIVVDAAIGRCCSSPIESIRRAGASMFGWGATAVHALFLGSFRADLVDFEGRRPLGIARWQSGKRVLSAPCW